MASRVVVFFWANFPKLYLAACKVTNWRLDCLAKVWSQCSKNVFARQNQLTTICALKCTKCSKNVFARQNQLITSFALRCTQCLKQKTKPNDNNFALKYTRCLVNWWMGKEWKKMSLEKCKKGVGCKAKFYIGKTNTCWIFWTFLNQATYRVSFFTGPAQKSSKYGTGPAQQRKTTKFTEDGKNPY